MFVETIKKILSRLNKKDLHVPDRIVNALLPHCVTTEDVIHFVQFKALLDYQGGFVFDIVDNKDKPELAEVIERITLRFDAQKISSHVYAFYISAVMNAVGIVTERVEWINPLKDDLASYSESCGNAATFGLGTFIERQADFKIQGSKVLGVNTVRDIVTIPCGVSSVGQEAFKGKSSISLVFIPDTVNEIMSEAFAGCTGLQIAVIGGRVKEIGASAFRGDSSLALVIADSVTDVLPFAFEGTAIKSLKRMPNLTEIGEGAFRSCKGLRALDLTKVRRIGKNAFSGCDALESVTVSTDGVSNRKFFEYFADTPKQFGKEMPKLKHVTVHVGSEGIPDCFFEGCSQVETIKIIGEVNKLGMGAFVGCQSMTQLTMDYRGTEIPDGAFAGCHSLESLPYMPNITSVGYKSFANCTNLKETRFGELKSIAKAAFANCEALVKPADIFSVDTLEENCLKNCKKISDFSFLNGVKKFDRCSLTGVDLSSGFEIPQSVRFIEATAFSDAQLPHDLRIPEGVVINPMAFFGAKGASALTFDSLDIRSVDGKSVRPYELFSGSIEEFNAEYSSIVNLRINAPEIKQGFAGWTHIQKVLITSPVKEIPAAAFHGCSSLLGVKIQSNNVALGEYAFADCEKLIRIASSLPPANISTADGRFEGDVISLSVFSKIGSYAFSGCKSLGKVMDISISSIGQGVFSGCSDISEIEIEMGDAATEGATLYSIFGTDRDTFRGEYPKLEYVMLNTLSSVPREFFDGCSSIKEIKIVGAPERIESSAFRGCSGLTSLDFNAMQCTLISSEAFSGCTALSSLPSFGAVLTVEERAFSDCGSIKEITLAPEVAHIGDGAFMGCKALARLNVRRINTTGVGCFVGCDSLSMSELIGALSVIKKDAFSNTVFDNSFVIPSTVSHIEAGAFLGATFPESFAVPRDIKIDPLAFEGVKGIRALTFGSLDIRSGDGSAVEPHNLFARDKDEFNEKYREIVNLGIQCPGVIEGFSGWKFIEKILISAPSVQIGDNCFRDCTSLVGVKIAAGSISLGAYAFFGCKNLSRIVTDNSESNKIKSTLNLSSFAKIGEGAFSGCESIQRAVLLGAKALSKNVLKGCTGIEEISADVSELSGVGSHIYRLFEEEADGFADKYPSLSRLEVRLSSSFPSELLSGCSQIKEIDVSGAIEIIEPRTFAGCIALEKLTVDASNCHTVSEEAFLDCRSLALISDFPMASDIGQSAFRGCESLQAVRIAQKDAAVGDYAFANCSKLKNVYGLEEAITVGDYALAGTAIEEAYINPRLEYLGVGVFSKCNELKSVNVPMRFSFIGSLFDIVKREGTVEITETDGRTARSYYLPEKLKSITVYGDNVLPGSLSGLRASITVRGGNLVLSDYALYGTSGELTIESDSLSIGSYALADCSGIKAVTSDGVSSSGTLSNVRSIAPYAFENSFNLKRVELSDGARLSPLSLAGAKGLESVRLDLTGCSECLERGFYSLFTDKREAFALTYPSLKSVEVRIPSLIPESFFEGCSQIESIKIIGEITDIGRRAFSECLSLTELSMDAHATVLTDEVFSGCSALGRLSCLDKVKGIGARAFMGCSSLESVTLSSEIEVISEGAFDGCSSLKSLDFKFVGECLASRVFAGCKSITSLPSLDSVTAIQDDALEGVNSIEIVKCSSRIRNISEIFASSKNCVKEMEISVVDDIPARYINGFTALRSLTLVGSGFSIGEYAFADNASLSEIIGLGGAVSVGDCAFMETAIERVSLSPDVSALGVGIFSRCSKLSSVTVPLRFEFFGALFDKEKQKETNETASCYGDKAEVFYVPNSLKNIKVYIDREVPSGAFSGLEADITLLGDSLVLSDYALYGASGKITLDSDSVSVGSFALAQCNTLKAVCSGESDEDGVITNVRSVAPYAFSGSKGIECIDLMDSVRISPMSLADLTELKSVSLDLSQCDLSLFDGFYSLFTEDLRIFTDEYKSLKNIELKLAGAVPGGFFAGCSQIETIRIMGEIDKMGAEAFKDCISLKELHMDALITELPDEVFSGCVLLSQVPSFERVSRIGMRAFSGCGHITSLDFSPSVEMIGAGAFDGCTCLGALSFKYVGESIRARTFAGCASLTSLPVLSSVESIEDDAFDGVKNIKTVKCSSRIENFSTVFESAKNSIEEIEVTVSDAIPERFINGFSSLKRVSIVGDSFTIGEYAFAENRALSVIAGLGGATAVGDYAFMRTAVMHVHLSSSTRALGIGIFSRCSMLTGITVPIRFGFIGSLFDITSLQGTVELKQTNGESGRKYYLPKSLTNLTVYADKEVPAGSLSGLKTNLTIVGEIETLGDYALYSATGNVTYNFTSLSKIGERALSGVKLGEVILPSVRHIGANAFALSHIESLAIGDKIEFIDESSLEGVALGKLTLSKNKYYSYASGMLISSDEKQDKIIYLDKSIGGDVVIPNGIKVITSEQFAGRKGITSIDTNGVERIEDGAFSQCSNIQSFVCGDSLSRIGKEILLGCSKLMDLNLPFVGSDIASSSPLSYIVGDTKIISPLSLVIRGGCLSDKFFDVRSGDSSLNYELIDISSVTNRKLSDGLLKEISVGTLRLPTGLETVSDKALVKVALGEVEYAGDKLIIENNSIYSGKTLVYHYCCGSDLIIRSGTENISEVAFDLNNSESKLIIEESVSEKIMGSKMFSLFGNIDDVEIASSLNMPLTAFLNKKLKRVTYFGERIGEGMFSGLIELQYIRIPKASFIGDGAFTRCSLANLELSPSLSLIAEGAFNDAMIGNIILSDCEAYRCEGGLLMSSDGRLLYAGKFISGELAVPETVRVICDRAFKKCSNITKLHIGVVDSIGAEAFCGCDGLTEFIVESAKAMSKDILSGCNSLEKLTLPYVGVNNTSDGLCHLNDLFGGHVSNKLMTVCITEQKVIDGTFKNITSLNYVFLSENTTSIKNGAFENCIWLRAIDIPASVTWIDGCVFDGCKSLKTVTVASLVQSNKWHRNWDITHKRLLFSSRAEVKVVKK